MTWNLIWHLHHTPQHDATTTHTQRLISRANDTLRTAENYARHGNYQRADIELDQAENYARIIDARLENFRGHHRQRVAHR